MGEFCILLTMSDRAGQPSGIESKVEEATGGVETLIPPTSASTSSKHLCWVTHHTGEIGGKNGAPIAACLGHQLLVASVGPPLNLYLIHLLACFNINYTVPLALMCLSLCKQKKGNKEGIFK